MPDNKIPGHMKNCIEITGGKKAASSEKLLALAKAKLTQLRTLQTASGLGATSNTNTATLNFISSKTFSWFPKEGSNLKNE